MAQSLAIGRETSRVSYRRRVCITGRRYEARVRLQRCSLMRFGMAALEASTTSTVGQVCNVSASGAGRFAITIARSPHQEGAVRGPVARAQLSRSAACTRVG